MVVLHRQLISSMYGGVPSGNSYLETTYPIVCGHYHFQIQLQKSRNIIEEIAVPRL